MNKRVKEKENEEISETKLETSEPIIDIEKKHNKQLRGVLILLGSILLVSLMIFFVINSIRNFEYRNAKFEVVKEKDLIFYKTFFPVYSATGKHTADYNIYLRNDPRKLKDISFDGDMNLLSNMVINSSGDFTCDGDGTIAIANMASTFNFFGTKVIKDANASCDSRGRYMFVQIDESNETSIKQFGPACYELKVSNCEILKVTERFMDEAIVKLNEK